MFITITINIKLLQIDDYYYIKNYKFEKINTYIPGSYFLEPEDEDKLYFHSKNNENKVF